jgi:putative aminopeptidase FrvX
MLRRCAFALVLLALPGPLRADEVGEAAALLRRLVAAPGAPGYEGPVRSALRPALPSWATAVEDNLGNLSVTLGSGAPKRLLVAHMDEPGYVVTAITDGGYLRLQRLSRSALPPLFDQFVMGQPVVIGARRGPIPGVVVIYSTHLWRAAAPPITTAVRDEDLFLDAGARSPAEARAAGLALLDPVVVARRVVDLAGGRVAGPALDDRAGCAALVLLLRLLEPVKVRGTLTVAFSTQETVQARGAARLRERLAPEEVLVVDAPLPLPGPGAAPASLAAGGGPVIGVPGGPSGSSPDLYARAASRGATLGVPLQSAPYGAPGDAAAFSGRARVLALGVPVLYPGTAAEVADPHDAVALAHLLKALVEGEP